MAVLPLVRIPLILHVEDDKAQVEALKSILEERGFVVLQASTAEGKKDQTYCSRGHAFWPPSCQHD